jgi:hypothetical protein
VFAAPTLLQRPAPSGVLRAAALAAQMPRPLLPPRLTKRHKVADVAHSKQGHANLPGPECPDGWLVSCLAQHRVALVVPQLHQVLHAMRVAGVGALHLTAACSLWGLLGDGMLCTAAGGSLLCPGSWLEAAGCLLRLGKRPTTSTLSEAQLHAPRAASRRGGTHGSSIDEHTAHLQGSHASNSALLAWWPARACMAGAQDDAASIRWRGRLHAPMRGTHQVDANANHPSFVVRHQTPG